MTNRLFSYYLQILLPVPALIWTAVYEGSLYFWGSLLVYIFYRMVTDANKLINSGAISKNDQWQLFTPFLSVKYFRQLYFK